MRAYMTDRQLRDRHHYARGYQNALQEIIEIAEQEGLDRALEYARANRDTRR